MSALCRRVGCQWREEHTGRDFAFRSEMNYRLFLDSWCWLCGKYRLCQVNFEKASIFGQRQSAWPFWEQPVFTLLPPFLFFPFSSFPFSCLPLSSHPSFVHRSLSSFCSCTSLTAPSANRDRHCLSTHPTDEAAFPFLLEYLYKFIGGCLY